MKKQEDLEYDLQRLTTVAMYLLRGLKDAKKRLADEVPVDIVICDIDDILWSRRHMIEFLRGYARKLDLMAIETYKAD